MLESMMLWSVLASMLLTGCYVFRLFGEIERNGATFAIWLLCVASWVSITMDCALLWLLGWHHVVVTLT